MDTQRNQSGSQGIPPKPDTNRNPFTILKITFYDTFTMLETDDECLKQLHEQMT